MKKTLLLSISALMAFTLSAQTTHDIEAGGGPGGPTPYYEPQFITIEVGDIVRWTNSGGTHNVDGTTETFPDNPEGFTNGSPSSSLWVFEHTFTIPGFYEFECAAFNHADTQFGSITVVDSSVGLDEALDLEMSMFPNPTSDRLTIRMESMITELKVYTLEMKEVLRPVISGLESTEVIEVSSLDPATYLLEVRSEAGTIHRRFTKD